MPLEWSPSLAVGVAEIDADHVELFHRAERLVRALRTGDRAGVEALFTYLAGYAERHFLAEERLMVAAGYPRLEEHRAAHARFRGELEGHLRAHARDGGSAAAGLALHNWLSDWLREHLAGLDRDLALHLGR
ncbi:MULTISPECIES: bacteriohemerythrin [Anaeromyxobacter]|uniref:bacteriohemerythrin n=1 Tax=Anaeromyxobacter TaxID=161492 RepID=UPI001F57E893|nr:MULTISPECIES: bacteriohemerythrin [unclassified Anaeromyxobacter]